MKVLIILFLNYYNFKKLVINANIQSYLNKNSVNINQCILFNQHFKNIFNKFNKCILKNIKKIKLKRYLVKKCFGKNNIKVITKISKMYNKFFKKYKKSIKNMTKKLCGNKSICKEFSKDIIKNLEYGDNLLEKIDKGVEIVETDMHENLDLYKNSIISIVKPVEICIETRSIFTEKLITKLVLKLDKLLNFHYRNRFNINFDKKNLKFENKIQEINYNYDLKDNYLKNNRKHLIKMIPWDDDVSLKMKYKVANRFISQSIKDPNEQENNISEDKNNYFKEKVKGFFNISQLDDKISNQYN